jgi:hypothetical protein
VTSVAVLTVAVAAVALVFYWSGRYGGRHRGGTSLKRGPRTHIDANGRAKVAYATRDDALAQARRMGRDGSSMTVYQCDTCARWHVGHAK